MSDSFLIKKTTSNNSQLSDSIKTKIISQFFPKLTINNNNQSKIFISYSDFTFLKFLFFPKSVYRKYRLVVNDQGHYSKLKINTKEKELLKKQLSNLK
jgi:muramoyltetrapeptide carboxypeptidase LdcA involved in peptidoglycan recycling